jgi:hypothetical protein
MVDSLAQKEQELSQQLASGALQGTERVAKAAELFEMRRTMDGYRVLAMFKQEGRDVSSAEYQKFIALMKPGTNAETYIQGMRELIQDLTLNSDMSIQNMMGAADAHNKDVDLMGLDPNLFKVGVQAQPFAESIKGTPVQKDYEFIMNTTGSNQAQMGAAAGNAGTVDVPAPNQGGGAPQAAIDFLNKNRGDPSIVQQFKDWYGYLPPEEGANSNVNQVPQGY